MNDVSAITQKEKDILLNAGWKFLNDNYIYIPDDYDGCMAYGIRILEVIQRNKQD